MANPAYPAGAFFKSKVVTPAVLVRKVKQRNEEKQWDRVCREVDARDKKVCQVTGKHLTGGAVDAWVALERHHLEARSKSKSRRFKTANVWTVCRAIHQLIHAGALQVLDKRGRPALSVDDIDHVAWTRTIVAKGDEPCKVRRGLAVKKDAE